jgi:hypothetical protein
MVRGLIDSKSILEGQMGDDCCANGFSTRHRSTDRLGEFIDVSRCVTLCRSVVFAVEMKVTKNL